MTGIRRVSQLGTTSTYVDGSIEAADLAVGAVPAATPTANGVVKGLTGDYTDTVTLTNSFVSFSFTLTSTGASTYEFKVYSTTLSTVFGATFSANFTVGKIADIYVMGMVNTGVALGATIVSVSSTTMVVSNPSYSNVVNTPESAGYGTIETPAYSVSGFGNTLLGNKAGIGLTALAGYSNENASNIVVGENAMSQSVIKAGGYYTDNNIVIGPTAGNNFYGSNNIMIGRISGNALTNAQSQNNYSTFIGFNTGSGVASSNGLTLIGNNLSGDYPTSANDAVVLGASGTNGIRIKNTGAVTMPNQPAFRYHGWTMTTSGLQGGTAPLNRGNSLSIGSGGTYSKFTAPVAGLYFIGASCLIETGTVRVEFIFTKNGSATFDGYDTYAINDSAPAGGGYTNVSGSYIFQLAAGDYIGMTPPVFGTLHANATRGDRMFYGYLIG